MRRDTVLAGPAVLLGLLAAGCNRQESPKSTAAAAPSGMQVAVVKPERRAIKRVVEQPGTILAYEETALHARIAGYVGVVADDPDKADRPPGERQVDIGSRVKKGQVLVELAVPELEMEWKQKQALVKQAEAEVVQAEKALAAAGEAVASAVAFVTEAEAGVARAQALYDRWQSEVSRISVLVSSGVIDAQTRDETMNQFKAAEASRAEAAARVMSARAAVKKAEADRFKSAADVGTAQARLAVAKAEVERVNALRGYTHIRAPFDGVVTARAVSTGAFVDGNGMAGLFTVARVDPVRVVVRVPEADAGLVNVGQNVQLVLQGCPTRPLRTGRVVRTSWSLVPGSRTLRTEIDLPNEDGVVRPGMYVHARLTAELPTGWSIPAAAVGKAGEEPVIFLAEGGKAVRVVVQLGAGDGKFTQILRYMRPGASDWSDVTGSESIVTPATAVTEGTALP